VSPDLGKFFPSPGAILSTVTPILIAVEVKVRLDRDLIRGALLVRSISIKIGIARVGADGNDGERLLMRHPSDVDKRVVFSRFFMSRTFVWGVMKRFRSGVNG
jgi:hypothetical protein